MKSSEAILKGYQQVGGRQTQGDYARGYGASLAVCVLGARNLGLHGDPFVVYGVTRFMLDFQDEWGVLPDILNDEGMPWEHIYGMAVAAGL